MAPLPRTAGGLKVPFHSLYFDEGLEDSVVVESAVLSVCIPEAFRIIRVYVSRHPSLSGQPSHCPYHTFCAKGLG